MISTLSYKKAFYAAVVLHLFLVVLLFSDSSSTRPVLTAEKKNEPGLESVAAKQQPEIIKAVSVDNKQVMETVNRLKQEKADQKNAEIKHQNELNRQAEAAKQQRVKEQQQLAKLKEEANKIAIERKKQIEEEKKHLKELAEQKEKEVKRVEELKKQKDQLVKEKNQETKKLAELNKKKLEAKAHAEEAKALKEQKQQAAALAAQQATQNAEHQARIAGEVDKYKALILNAIGRNWILPENANSSLSSQFRIRLAPDGTILDLSLTRSSGDPLLDRSAQTAIYKSAPLPVPSDADTFNLFRDISLTVRPEQVRG